MPIPRTERWKAADAVKVWSLSIASNYGIVGTPHFGTCYAANSSTPEVWARVEGARGESQ
jgi:hypothetical protein